MTWDGVLVRFGEIGIKSAPVRSAMLERLRQNLLAGLVRAGVEGDVQRRGPRIWMTGPAPDALLEVATRTFGVVSASRCRVVDSDMETLRSTAAAVALGEARDWRSFAVRARREGAHAFSSQDIGVAAGAAIYEAATAAGRAVRVDLGSPDLEVHIDVRQDRSYVFTSSTPGPGGLPVGAQGAAVVLLSDEQSAVAAWLMMRRGASVVALHAGDTGSVPVELVDALALWGMSPDVELLPVCTGSVSKAALLEAAAAVAHDVAADALVTGETLESDLSAASIPVLRPVCGLDAGTYEGFARRAGVLGLPGAQAAWDDASRETVESLLSMRRTVSV